MAASRGYRSHDWRTQLEQQPLAASSDYQCPYDDRILEVGSRSWNNSQWLPVAVADLLSGSRSWSNSQGLPVAVTDLSSKRLPVL